MFKFWKKAVATRPPRRLYIPKERIREVLEAYDDWNPNKAASSYNFWNLVASILPEVAEEGTNWRLERRQDVLRPYLEEKPCK